MLFVHEVHQVAGRESDRFDELYQEWSNTLAQTDDARLLWFMDQAHGTGPAYTFVTVTAVSSGAALDDLAERQRRGDLREWLREVDSLRHTSTAKVLEALPFSPMAELDLATVPAIGHPAAEDGSLPLFMEDTAWPHRGRYEDYLEKAGTVYVDLLRDAAAAGRNLLDLVAAFSPRYGSGHRREIVLWQRVGQPQGLVPLFSHEVPAAYRKPGTWMHDALEVRDQWESRLLRVSHWSPLG